MARVRICSGNSRTLWWVDDASGEFRAQTYFSQLSQAEQAKFEVLFELMASQGRIRNPEHFRKESGNIYCFKRGQLRLTCFSEGPDWMLVHGFRKKTNKDKRLKREIDMAERIRTEHLERTRGEAR
jgi:phage-related protein